MVYNMDFSNLNMIIEKGRVPLIKKAVEDALNEGISPIDILDKGLIVGMNRIGERFKNGQAYIPEVMLSAKAMAIGTEVIKPYFSNDGLNNKGTVVIGTVQGDFHDIGKNIVKIMMESLGLKVIDLGVNVPCEKFVEVAEKEEVTVIACSALLTTTMSVMGDVVKLRNTKNLAAKIIVGGAPITQEFACSIGADGYASDAIGAAELALKLSLK